MSKKRFHKQVVVVTGASSGIGRAAALAFAREGARTALLSRSREKLETVADEIRALGGDAFVAAADVASKEEVDAAVASVLDHYGRIDVLFNNAGRSDVGPTDAPWFIEGVREMFDVDYLGTVRVTQAVVPAMRKQGSGRILNMSSVMGRKAFAKFGGYASVMHAIIGYTDALRQELRGAGIDVSVILPSLTQTPLLSSVRPEDMPPAFRRLTPIGAEQVAEAALNGLARRKARIEVPWQPRLLMFAQALSPRLGDLFARVLQTPLFAWLFGTFRGRTYQHG
ncbi:MAG: SDR family oxidoreductase [Polyangiales bacterium]|jgi:NAD(P)-dependent dehydrogenase (short-subunit alcohol dehydrogenase family)